MDAKNISYQKAMEEIAGILATIENQEVDIDNLGDQLKRISHLIRICKIKLHHAEEEVEKILKEMET